MPPPPPPVLGGGAHSLAREGLGESQFRRGDIHCGTLYLGFRTIMDTDSREATGPKDQSEGGVGWGGGVV